MMSVYRTVLLSNSGIPQVLQPILATFCDQVSTFPVTEQTVSRTPVSRVSFMSSTLHAHSWPESPTTWPPLD